MSQPPNGITIGSSVFAGLTDNRHTDRQTDHANLSVATDHILCTECMWCGLIIILSVLSNLAKGRIAVLSHLAAANALLLVWTGLLQNCLLLRQCCFDIIADMDGA